MGYGKSRLIEEASKIANKKYPNGYNKQQLIECSKEVYGGFGKNVIFDNDSNMEQLQKTFNSFSENLDNAESVNDKRNAMAFIDGHYPVSISDCEVIGISGNCGIDCYVFAEGNCKEPQEFLNDFSDDELLLHPAVQKHYLEEVITEIERRRKANEKTN